MRMRCRWNMGALVVGVVSLVGLVRPLPASAADLNVVVTVKPVHSLVTAVMAGVGTPRLLIEGTSSPHVYTMKPSDAKLVHGANLLIRVSESLEPFTIKLVKSLPPKVRVVTLDAAPGLDLLPLREGGSFEAHDHGKGKAKHSHGHGHDHDHDHAKPGKNADGHIWLDPANGRKLAAYIAEQLSTLDPAHAETFKRNAASVDARLEKLTTELDATLKPVAGRPFIVFHDAYQYLEHRFGLTPVGSVTVSPDVPPSAKRLTELRRKIGSLKAVCVFAEPQFVPKVIDTIVEGTSARRGTLDPYGSSLPSGSEQYDAMLRALANDVRTCLAEPS